MAVAIADTREKQQRAGGEGSSLQHCSTAVLSLRHHLQMYAMGGKKNLTTEQQIHFWSFYEINVFIITVVELY